MVFIVQQTVCSTAAYKKETALVLLLPVAGYRMASAAVIGFISIAISVLWFVNRAHSRFEF